MDGWILDTFSSLTQSIKKRGKIHSQWLYSIQNLHNLPHDIFIPASTSSSMLHCHIRHFHHHWRPHFECHRNYQCHIFIDDWLMIDVDDSWSDGQQLLVQKSFPPQRYSRPITCYLSMRDRVAGIFFPLSVNMNNRWLESIIDNYLYHLSIMSSFHWQRAYIDNK